MLVPLPRTEDLPAFYPPVYTFGLDLGGRSLLKRWLGKLEYGAFYRPQRTDLLLVTSPDQGAHWTAPLTVNLPGLVPGASTVAGPALKVRSPGIVPVPPTVPWKTMVGPV